MISYIPHVCSKSLCISSDPNIKKYISLCEARLADQKQREKTHYKGMFDRLAEEADEENTAAASPGGGDTPAAAAHAS